MNTHKDTAPGKIPIRRGVARTGAVELAYEDWGDPASPPVLLIMGLGAQMLLWPDGFCRDLERAGLRVIRFDNRDVGLSGRFHPRGPAPPLWRLMLRAQFGLSSSVPYSLVAMAQDTVTLLDELNLEHAHIVGASMGGMIAQVLAADHPRRVDTLTLVFTSTNQPLLPPPSRALIRIMLRGPGPQADAPRQKAHMKTLLRALGSSDYPLPEADLDDLVDRISQRGIDAEGGRRQLMAMLGTGSLRSYCRRIGAPTLVIHGEKDPMIPKAAGLAVMRAIPGAALHLIPGMGHDLPPALWPDLIDVIARHVNRSDLLDA